MNDMNGWESFKYDVSRFVCGLCGLVTTMVIAVGVVWYFGYIKVACIGNVCGVLFR